MPERAHTSSEIEVFRCREHPGNRCVGINGILIAGGKCCGTLVRDAFWLASTDLIVHAAVVANVEETQRG